jgi:ribosomal protein L11 methyltransferase
VPTVDGPTVDVVVELDVVGGADAVALASADLWASGATAIGETSGGLSGQVSLGGPGDLGDDGVGPSDEVGERAPGGVTLVASFPTPGAARAVAVELGGRAVEVTDTSWRDRWKDFAQPVTVGDDLVVAPTWRDVAVGDGRLVVHIDPGPCFGSGSHPSTRLLLARLMDDPPAGRRVLDVGCGSGILSVTAALLGAASVVAVDIDPDAVTATVRNASFNAVGSAVSASSVPLSEVGHDFDLVLVNVTAGVHAVVGPASAAAARPGATLLLAGLLPGQWRHVADAYPATVVLDRPSLEGWEGVVLRREGGGAPPEPPDR